MEEPEPPDKGGDQEPSAPAGDSREAVPQKGTGDAVSPTTEESVAGAEAGGANPARDPAGAGSSASAGVVTPTPGARVDGSKKDQKHSVDEDAMEHHESGPSAVYDQEAVRRADSVDRE